MKTSLIILLILSTIPSALAAGFVAKTYPLDDEKTQLMTLTQTIKKDDATETLFGVFTNMKNEPILTDKAILKNGKAVRYEIQDLQMNEGGVVEIRDGRIFYSYTRNGKTKTDDEKAPDADKMFFPATTNNWITDRLDKLIAGEKISGRIISPDRMETIGFDYEKVNQPDDKTNDSIYLIKMSASSPFIRWSLKKCFSRSIKNPDV